MTSAKWKVSIKYVDVTNKVDMISKDTPLSTDQCNVTYTDRYSFAC